MGSPDVNVNGRPALRKDDVGIHAACCGPNMWKATAGSSTVNINGKPAHRLNDAQQHCGGNGQLIEGSADVIIGDASGGGGGSGSGGSGGGGPSGESGSTGDPQIGEEEVEKRVDGEAQAKTLETASEDGTPFCEECERAAEELKEEERKYEEEEAPAKEDEEQVEALENASRDGTPFCEECERARKEMEGAGGESDESEEENA
jgi:uncharacterized Zn-binding protein involved in type VI secretion